SSLALESPNTRRICRELLWQDLQSDLSAKLGILRPVHNSHATLAEFGQDLVMSEAGPDHRRHVCVRSGKASCAKNQAAILFQSPNFRDLEWFNLSSPSTSPFPRNPLRQRQI